MVLVVSLGISVFGSAQAVPEDLGVSSSTTSLPVMGCATQSVCSSMPDDCWSQEDDELTLQYPELLLHPRLVRDRDTISQMSIDSTDSGRLNGGGGAVGGGGGGDREPIFIAAGDIRRRLSESLKASHSPSIAFSSTFFLFSTFFFRNRYLTGTDLQVLF